MRRQYQRAQSSIKAHGDGSVRCSLKVQPAIRSFLTTSRLLRIAGCLCLWAWWLGTAAGESTRLPPRVPGGLGVDEIVRRGGEVLASDWGAWTKYSYIERDETRKGEQVSSRTSRVVMIAESDYYLPIAINDQPLSDEQSKAELEKLRAEVRRRKAESAESRAQRVARFRKQQDENGALVLEFPKALTYTLAGEEEKNGHPAWRLATAPKKRAGPLSRAAKVISGMAGTVWVDRDGFHTIRGDCQVMAPISMFSFFARVLPGTRIEIELQPVSETVWLISRYTVKLTISKLWFKSTQMTDSTYSDFRPNEAVLAELLGEVP